MTVQEYLDAPWWRKAGYRVMRNPFAMFLIGPVLVFVIGERRPPARGKREIASVWWTNLALVVMITVMGLTFGWRNYMVTQLLVLFFGTSAGVWLSYVQHNFEGVYWERHGQWNYFQASMQGSSFYKLPALLQWFSGNIGFHHIHHLGSRIPNYNLGKFGGRRLPNFYEFSLRVEKTFNISEKLRFTVSGDCFNVFNAATALGQQLNLATPSTFGQTRRILNPRVFRAGFRIEF